ncbi:carbohydrate ABC transporter permease [Blautia liquoris]|uniref:carbohydrate ABC transporter permease n=1 Tax=Blautia liquoris TaxID=2779518 RepID=UPI001A9B58E0|nr:sugar ABC transporter permease [Blautia liquoris]
MNIYKNRKIVLLFISPVIIGLSIFVYYPLIQTILGSLFEWMSYSPEHKWVGLHNYVSVFTNKGFGRILFNNSIYAVISVICQVGISMVLAACLEEMFMRKFQGFFRTVLFLPSLISMSVIALLWKCIFNPNNGLINTFLISVLGVTNLPTWLGDEQLAIFCCIFISQWQYVGYCVLLDLIGIQKIPQEIYESAVIDGAGSIKKFFYITLPMGKESILVTSILTLVGSYKIFTEIQVLTGGGPGRASEVLATAMYRAAFVNDEMGVASAYAVIIFTITLVLSLVQMKVSNTGKEADL